VNCGVPALNVSFRWKRPEEIVYAHRTVPVPSPAISPITPDPSSVRPAARSGFLAAPSPAPAAIVAVVDDLWVEGVEFSPAHRALPVVDPVV
jgi:hypothetical protein